MGADDTIDIRVRVLGPPKYDQHGNFEVTVADAEGRVTDVRVWNTHHEAALRVGSTYDFQQLKQHPPEENRARYETGGGTQISRLGQPAAPDISLLHVSDTHMGRETTTKDDAGVFDHDGRFLDAVNIALTRRVDGLLLTGDFFDDGVTPETVRMVGDHLAVLDDHDIPVYHVRGNHGCEKGDDLLHTEIREGRVVPLDDEPVVLGKGALALYGMDNDAAETGLPEAAPSGPVPADAYRLLAWHDAVEPVARCGVPIQRVVAASDVELDALALGDLHKSKRAYLGDTRDATGRSLRAFYAGATTAIAQHSEGYNPAVWDLQFSEGTLERHRVPLRPS